MYIKKLTKSGQISLPAELYKQAGFKDGEYVTIYKEANQLVISSHHTDDYLNKCIFRNGRLSIPMELRKMLNINATTFLMIQSAKENKSLIIKIVVQQENHLLQQNSY
ncbi:AbrB/MazE/SpoVT family DNA-binding domain-containing protein [Cytobacillus oceanisediminis]|uniref:SpoVT-AbrB domain-containing protein n=1 Tax=Cytobacillus oceanisediminis TaxID=665099 RepID=A0A562JC76_9BACI|nr:AbrB/MazE/SpoVT family DNA-binding domain-containing protein [Cytobacillus oceanisediminis]TWH80812.1 hypothetical protein IQ19_04554 [Cytobacillus oceanisediminis]